VRKQEAVITKMEALLSKTMKDTQRAREGVLELEKLKTENLELQSKMKEEYGAGAGDSEELQRLRTQVDE
jgi:hypothetical protein